MKKNKRTKKQRVRDAVINTKKFIKKRKRIKENKAKNKHRKIMFDHMVTKRQKFFEDLAKKVIDEQKKKEEGNLKQDSEITKI